MVIFGIDAHKRTHTVVAIDEAGRKLGEKTTWATTIEANLELRLSRTGNRQPNAAIHRIAVTQMRIHEPAKAYLERRIAMGNTKSEAIRALKRMLSDVVDRRLLADADAISVASVGEAA